MSEMDDDTLQEVRDELPVSAPLDEGQSVAVDARQLVAKYFPLIQAMEPQLSAAELKLLRDALGECGVDESTDEPVLDLDRLTLPQLAKMVDAIGHIAENHGAGAGQP